MIVALLRLALGRLAICKAGQVCKSSLQQMWLQSTLQARQPRLWYKTSLYATNCLYAMPKVVRNPDRRLFKLARLDFVAMLMSLGDGRSLSTGLRLSIWHVSRSMHR